MAHETEPTRTSPALRDAHREFRRGTWSRPFLLVAVAGGLLGALSLLSAEKPKEDSRAAASLLNPKAEPDSFTIGSSQGPDRIPDVPAKDSPRRRVRDEQEAPTKPSGIVPEKQFAAEFKHKAAQKPQN